MHPPALHAATWIFSWLVPKDIREPLMGDLAEEYALRVKTVSSLQLPSPSICFSIQNK